MGWQPAFAPEGGAYQFPTSPEVRNWEASPASDNWAAAGSTPVVSVTTIASKPAVMAGRRKGCLDRSLMSSLSSRRLPGATKWQESQVGALTESVPNSSSATNLAGTEPSSPPRRLSERGEIISYLRLTFG